MYLSFLLLIYLFHLNLKFKIIWQALVYVSIIIIFLFLILFETTNIFAIQTIDNW